MSKIINVLDGGFGGQLSRHVGVKIDGDPLWTARFLATNPTAVYDTHMDFLRAGADIIETNTYQASIPGFMKYLNMSSTESLNLLLTAVHLAKKAANDYSQEKGLCPESKPKVVGSCGPYGAYLHDISEYTGAYGKTMSRKELYDWHRPRFKALLDAGVDLLAFETIPCVEEAEALLDLLKEFSEARAWLSFSCRDDCHISDGSVFKEVALRCYHTLPSQIVAVGVNCVDPKYVTPLLQSINPSLEKKQIPLVVYPNRGDCFTIGEQAVASDDLLNLPISDWLDLGVRYLGGCCKIFAEDIKTIRSEVNQWLCSQGKNYTI
ncbi:hypothetical protein PUN28_005145 [Cardiocondyla obscurior]|uniref:Hcy-binding domain-containing protein n=1 Tax=Cardiocondyla obscurior TaxID=286306 RepID=A0AAW2GEZ0_9HYME